MNEKLQELAEQAETKEVGYYFFDREKFAELIVNECANLFPLTFTDEQYQRRIDKTIRKHFGLEE